MTRLILRQVAVPAEFAPHAHPSAGLPGFVQVDLGIDNGRIDSLTPAADRAAGDCPIVLPGFIDIHIHGAAGSDTMDATPEALATIASFQILHGVTGFYATTMTAPPAATLAAVAAAAQAGARPGDGARLLGVHLEGPFISPHFPGAQNAQDIRLPDVAEFHALIAAGPVRMITLAPEQPGADELIDAARRLGVVTVAGHTNGSYAECEAAIRLGVTQATHTYNAMTGLHHRNPGVLGSVLSNDTIDAQLIADNIHVHPAAMRILARCKGAERTILITDAMRAAGLPPGRYDLGGQPVTVENGACRLADGTLAGSVLTMDRALVNFLEATGWSLAQTWPTTSRSAARSLGIDHEIGSLQTGYRADLVVLDRTLAVVATLIDGEIVYRRPDARIG